MSFRFWRKHEHQWKAVRFAASTTMRISMFSASTEVSTTRVSWECQTCPARRISESYMNEADARWLARAEGEPESVPDAFVRAFDGDAS